MTDTSFNKYRAAASVLQRGREMLVETMADDILEQSDDLLEGGYAFHEFLENQGTRIHFLSLLVAQLEQTADEVDERGAAEAAVAARKHKARKPRTSTKRVGSEKQPPRGEAPRKDREGQADEA